MAVISRDKCGVFIITHIHDTRFLANYDTKIIHYSFAGAHQQISKQK